MLQILAEVDVFDGVVFLGCVQKFVAGSIDQRQRNRRTGVYTRPGTEKGVDAKVCKVVQRLAALVGLGRLSIENVEIKKLVKASELGPRARTADMMVAVTFSYNPSQYCIEELGRRFMVFKAAAGEGNQNHMVDKFISFAGWEFEEVKCWDGKKWYCCIVSVNDGFGHDLRKVASAILYEEDKSDSENDFKGNVLCVLVRYNDAKNLFEMSLGQYPECRKYSFEYLKERCMPITDSSGKKLKPYKEADYKDAFEAFNYFRQQNRMRPMPNDCKLGNDTVKNVKNKKTDEVGIASDFESLLAQVEIEANEKASLFEVEYYAETSNDLFIGDKVTLVREADATDGGGKNAVAIKSLDGQTVGYLDERDAIALAAMLDFGYVSVVSAVIDSFDQWSKQSCIKVKFYYDNKKYSLVKNEDDWIVFKSDNVLDCVLASGYYDFIELPKLQKTESLRWFGFRFEHNDVFWRDALEDLYPAKEFFEDFSYRDFDAINFRPVVGYDEEANTISFGICTFMDSVWENCTFEESSCRIYSRWSEAEWQKFKQALLTAFNRYRLQNEMTPISDDCEVVKAHW